MRAPYTEVEYVCSPIASGAARPSDRPTRAAIDLHALTHNYAEVTRRIGGRKVLAVVKAQAYGHGAVPVARHVAGLGAHMLGVALVEEGRDLRDAGITAPILVMGPVFPEQAEALVRANLTPVVYTLPVAKALSDAATDDVRVYRDGAPPWVGRDSAARELTAHGGSWSCTPIGAGGSSSGDFGYSYGTAEPVPADPNAAGSGAQGFETRRDAGTPSHAPEEGGSGLDRA